LNDTECFAFDDYCLLLIRQPTTAAAASDDDEYLLPTSQTISTKNRCSPISANLLLTDASHPRMVSLREPLRRLTFHRQLITPAAANCRQRPLPSNHLAY
jgi:hypothetical protein